jgi:hypothetical protein
MAERVFAGKLQRAGFAELWVGGHQPFGIDQAALYPLFTPEVIQVMRETRELAKGLEDWWLELEALFGVAFTLACHRGELQAAAPI